MSIYQDIILDHYRSPRNQKKIDNPTKFVNVTNPLCGDVISMYVMIDNGVITDIGYEGHGCAISQASASLLTEYIKGKPIETTKHIDAHFIQDMIGVELSPNRLKCALLSWEAFIKIIHN